MNSQRHELKAALRDDLVYDDGGKTDRQKYVHRLQRAVSKELAGSHEPNCPIKREVQQAAEPPPKTQSRGRQRAAHSHPAADTGSDEKEKDETDDTPEPYPSDKTKTISN